MHTTESNLRGHIIKKSCPQSRNVLSKYTKHEVTHRIQPAVSPSSSYQNEGKTTMYHPSFFPPSIPSLLPSASQPLCQAPDAHGRWQSGQQVSASWHHKHLLSLPNANCHQSGQHLFAFVCRVHKWRCLRSRGNIKSDV